MRAPVVVLLLGLSACSSPAWERGPSLPVGPVSLAEVTPGSSEAAVVTELEGLYADLSARDWPAFADHFWEGATMTTLWQPPGEHAPRVVVSSVPEFVAGAPQGPGSREVFEERMVDADVRVHGPLAYVWSRFDARFGDPGEIAEWQGVDAFTLFRHAERWRVVSVSYVADP